jgi:hypothetical protein
VLTGRFLYFKHEIYLALRLTTFNFTHANTLITLKKFIKILVTVFGIIVSLQAKAQPVVQKPGGNEKLLGMYMHQHWSYKHPYAVRTWTFEDWRGYLDGLHRLGYNAILIWPMLETMPNPLTPSDEAQIVKIASVIDMAHKDFNMNVSIVLCPNVAAKNEEARKYTFQDRPFFHTDDRVDPGDPVVFGKLMAWREKLFAPLAKIDGLYIIDSDPGGYPNSTNMEFVYILGAHRRMLDHLRPGIELDYWALAGWEAYSKYYATGKFEMGPDKEIQNAVSLIAKQHYEPWGVASHRGPSLLDTLAMSNRVIAFPYGVIEGEPSFPMTIYGGERAYSGSKNGGARGIMGNAQTHCIQLPNTFAFARGAQGLSAEKSDYIKFANDLLTGQGELIVESWQCLQGNDLKRMNANLKRLQSLKPEALTPGPLKGLLFGDPARFINDLVMQLQLTISMYTFSSAVDQQPRNAGTVRKSLASLASAAQVWQQQHGYSNRWNWKPMEDALHKLGSESINTILDNRNRTSVGGSNPFENVKKYFMLMESFTPRLIEAMKSTVKDLEKK